MQGFFSGNYIATTERPLYIMQIWHLIIFIVGGGFSLAKMHPDERGYAMQGVSQRPALLLCS